jgi:hypothetical protein
MWFADGMPLGVENVTIPDGGFATSGETVIGSFAGVLDEVGVHVLDRSGLPGADQDLYKRAMMVQHGAALVFADGFDGSRLTPDWTSTDAVVAGGGVVTVPEAETLITPAFSVSRGITTLEIQLPGTGTFSAGWKEGTLLLSSVEPDGNVEPVMPVEETLLLEATADSVVLTSGQERMEILGPAAPDEVTVTFEGPLVADSVVVHRD